MKTKMVEFYCDLLPEKSEGARRIRVLVELPCFGGSVDVDQTIAAGTQNDPEPKEEK